MVENNKTNMRLVKTITYCPLHSDYYENWLEHAITMHGYEIVDMTETTVTRIPKGPKPMFDIDVFEEVK